VSTPEPGPGEGSDPRLDIEDGIMAICQKDARYRPAAYRFVMYEGIEYTTREHLKLTEKTRRHLTGAELCEGLRKLALKQFGFMALDVWRSWGIHGTRDWGHVVFTLCENNLLSRNDTDCIEDFENVFDMEKGLRQAFRFQDVVAKA
jgi:uncharacterized repeat protein (TIGR04138 family)